MLCHIFKTGEHTDSSGNKRNWTTEDLDKICYQFNNVHNNVPICVGHPKTSSPAYGWLNEVKRIGNDLYCSFKEVQSEFKQALKQGLFKNRSISLDKDLNIRHLAFLGAQAPAIKGLETFCFSDTEELQIFEMSDYTDKDIPKNKEGNVEEELQKQLSEKDETINKLQSELDSVKKAQLTKEFEDFTNSVIEKGNILPKDKDRVVSILSALSEADKNMSFSDGEKTCVEQMKDFISEIKPHQLEKEIIKDSQKQDSEFSDSNPKSIAAELDKIMADKKCDLITAFANMQKGN